MKLSPNTFIPPLAALIVGVIVVQQTSEALKSSGAWKVRVPSAVVVRPDPYARLDDLVSRPPVGTPAPRDPFAFGGAIRVEVGPTNTVHRPLAPTPAPAPALPTLTAIIWDNDPRATIRFNGRDFSVRENSLFADFRVASISATQVVLERDGQSVVLMLNSKGDQ